MKKFETLRSVLTEKLPGIVLLLFLFQPLMDVISFWLTELGKSNVMTLLLRFGVLGMTVLTGFLLSHRKSIYWIAAGICLMIGIGHIYALYDYAAPASLVSDLTNYVRVLQMPLTAMCLITFLRENPRCYEAMKHGVVGSLAIILVVEVLAIVTGTDPHTYVDGRGVLGWFNNTNSQSSILCMIVPVSMAWSYEKKGVQSPWFWMISLGGLGALFLLGTRLGLFSLVASGFGLGLSQIIIKPSRWKQAICFVLAAVVFLCLLPMSPMTSHQGTYSMVQTNRQAIIDERLAAYDLKPLDEAGISEEELQERKALWIEALSYTYSYHAEDFVKIFGLEQTIEHYNYSKDINVITEQRPKKLMFGELLMENSPLSARLFGVELARFTVGKNIYDVENDFHGVYFLYGWVGLAAMCLFLLYFIWLILKALLKNFKQYFTMEAASWGVALVCCLLHVYNTAGVLRRPNASFYLAAVLAAIYYLVQVKEYSEK